MNSFEVFQSHFMTPRTLGIVEVLDRPYHLSEIVGFGRD